MDKSCPNCIYAERDPKYPRYYYCHRYPPKCASEDTDDADNFYYPPVFSSDWCGEFKPNTDQEE